MSLVLDSSVTLAWLYSDEATPAVLAVFDRVILEGAFVPSLWPFEVANSLTMAVRQRRIAASERNDSLTDLASLPIEADRETEAHAWGKTTQLADRHELSVYDAAYLELALRRQLPLARLDSDLSGAASTEGVQVLGI
jgi:predicted nucleic acid-binding protein